MKEFNIKKFEKDYPYLNNRNRKGFSYFKSSITHLITLLGFVGTLALFFGISYFGIIGGLNELERQRCESYQNYRIDYPDSIIKEEDLTRCEILKIKIQ